MYGVGTIKAGIYVNIIMSLFLHRKACGDLEI